jgi:hypothetical protein
MYGEEKKLSLEIKSACVLILGFPTFRTVKNKFIVYKTNLCFRHYSVIAEIYFVIAALYFVIAAGMYLQDNVKTENLFFLKSNKDSLNFKHFIE